MDYDIHGRIRRIYEAIGAIEEDDPNKLRATFIQTECTKGFILKPRDGFSDEALSNQVHLVMLNIANLRDHLRRWAVKNGHDKARVDKTVKSSFELQIVIDLFNNDKHGYPPRGSGLSGRLPRIIQLDRIMRLQTQPKPGSMIAMTIGTGGVPRFFGDGTAKAVTTAAVVDKDNNHIGDLYDVVQKAVEAWEALLMDFGLL